MSTDPTRAAFERIEAIVKGIKTQPRFALLNPGNGNVQEVRTARPSDNSRPFTVLATALPEEDEMAGYISQRWRCEGAVEVRLTRGTRDRRQLQFLTLKLARLLIEALGDPRGWKPAASGIDDIIVEQGSTDIEDEGAALILSVPFTVIYTEA